MPDQAAWPPHVVEWATERTEGQSLSEEWERGPMLLGRSDFDGFYQTANARHIELLGWTIAELASVSWWEFVHPDDRDGMVEGIELMMKIGRWDDAKMSVLTRDGPTGGPGGASSPTRTTRSPTASAGTTARIPGSPPGCAWASGSGIRAPTR